MNIEELDDLEFLMKDLEKDQGNPTIKNKIPIENKIPELNKKVEEPKAVEGKYRLPIKVNSTGKVLDDETKPTIIGTFTMTGAVRTNHPGGKHLGIDLQAPKGTPIYPIGPGVVIKIGTESSNPSGGNSVTVHHVEQDPDLTSYYAHMLDVKVGIGQKVDVNDILGGVSNTGKSARYTSTHLHYQTSIKNVEVDPNKVIGKDYGFTNPNFEKENTGTISKIVTASELYLKLCNRLDN